MNRSKLVVGVQDPGVSPSSSGVSVSDRPVLVISIPRWLRDPWLLMPYVPYRYHHRIFRIVGWITVAAFGGMIGIIVSGWLLG